MDVAAYTLLVSGHGSRWRYEGGDGTTPTIFLGRDEAFRRADEWVGLADSIGGDALVEHVPTGERWDFSGRSIKWGEG